MELPLLPPAYACQSMICRQSSGLHDGTHANDGNIADVG